MHKPAMLGAVSAPASERAEPLGVRLVDTADGNSESILKKLRQEIADADANQ